MSGGRATVAPGLVRQAGDICAVAPEGNALASQWFIECKHVRQLRLDRFIVHASGPLWDFWQTCLTQAGRHRRDPVLVGKQAGLAPIVIAFSRRMARVTPLRPLCTLCTDAVGVYHFADLVDWQTNPYRPRLSRWDRVDGLPTQEATT